MHSLSSDFLNSLRYSSRQLSTLAQIREYKGKQELFFQQTPQFLETLRQVALIESSESSNRIEGISAPRKRIEGLVSNSTNPANRSEQEIAGYRDALNLIHDSAQDMDFSVNVILQLHSYLFRYLPNEGGNWKITDNEIVERDSAGLTIRIRFTPTSALETPMAMETLALRYNAAIHLPGQEPLVVIAFAILDFLCIHPFQDGNGRMARLLTLLLLYHFGFEVGRFISLERIFEESKDTYYETLEESSRGWHESRHDPFPWMNYFWGTVLRAYKEFESRVDAVKDHRGAKSAQIRSAVFAKKGPFAISEITAELPGISRDMVRVVLRQLRDEGEIVQQGKGRGARWIRKSLRKD